MSNSRSGKYFLNFNLARLTPLFLRGDLGPLHMSPVDRASPVTEISPHSYFLCKNFDVFI